jgi:hypothetical protein
MIRLTCHAPHPDPMKRGQQCGTPLGAIDSDVMFVTTAEREPSPMLPGQIWIRCSRKTCGHYNRFTRLSKEQAS